MKVCIPESHRRERHGDGYIIPNCKDFVGLASRRQNLCGCEGGIITSEFEGGANFRSRKKIMQSHL